MMLLATEPAVLFFKFVQVLCWIVLPVLILIIAVTIILHYRRKKKTLIIPADRDQELLNAEPERIGYTNGNGDYVLFDHSQLIMEYKRRLSSRLARIAALQQDVTDWQDRYRSLAHYTKTLFLNQKIKPMKNENESQKILETEMKQAGREYAAERKEWQDRLEQMNKAFEGLEQENRSLQARLRLSGCDETEKDAVVQQWNEENARLRDRVAEQDYLRDLLEEKNAEIVFLRSQVEQRIRHQHEAERQRQQAMTDAGNARDAMAEALRQAETLKSELALKQDEVDKAQIGICAREEQLAGKDRELKERMDHISYIESVFRETKEKNELLNAELADCIDRRDELHRQVENYQAKVAALEEKLRFRKQMFRKLFKEFNTCMEEDSELSVMPLHETITAGRGE